VIARNDDAYTTSSQPRSRPELLAWRLDRHSGQQAIVAARQLERLTLACVLAAGGHDPFPQPVPNSSSMETVHIATLKDPLTGVFFQAEILGFGNAPAITELEREAHFAGQIEAALSVHRASEEPILDA
jgi:hypothetical protein